MLTGLERELTTIPSIQVQVRKPIVQGLKLAQGPSVGVAEFLRRLWVSWRRWCGAESMKSATGSEVSNLSVGNSGR